MAHAQGREALLTVGHGAQSSEDFLALLAGQDIGVLVDVRRHPGSRRHPHFGRQALSQLLTAHSIEYRWEEALGGRRHGTAGSPNVALRDPSFRAYADYMASAPFREAVAGVVRESRASSTAVMCAESVWWRCHRRLIADYCVLATGTPVLHLFHDGRLREHHLTDGVRAVGETVIYDLGADRELPEA